ncbi:transposase [Sinorhizobium meliloti]|nr:transposase [Sinorhizobium meliloti]
MLRGVADDPRHLGAEIGFIAVLHSWGQNFHYHPDIHCIVPSGSLPLDQSRWVACRASSSGRCGFCHACSGDCFSKSSSGLTTEASFSSSAVAGLTDPAVFDRSVKEVRRVDCNVYAKAPAGREQVLAYLGHYTHRIATANSRPVGIDGDRVTFRWKDYRTGGRQKEMTLGAH